MKKNAVTLLLLVCTVLCAHGITPGARIKDRPEAKNIMTSGRVATKSREEKRKKQSKLTLSTMNLEELAEAKERAIKKNQIDVAIKYVEQMMKLADETDLFSDLLLELADLYFKQELFDKASRLYAEFCSRYPGKKEIEYAERQAILTSFSCTLDSERDQTRTEETIARAHIFLAHETYVQYRQEVEKILTQCYEKLIDADLNICDFLIKRKLETATNFTDVEKRLQTVRSDYLCYAPHKEADLLLHELDVAKRKGDATLLSEKETALLEHIGTNATPILAQNKTRAFANRF